MKAVQADFHEALMGWGVGRGVIVEVMVVAVVVWNANVHGR